MADDDVGELTEWLHRSPEEVIVLMISLLRVPVRGIISMADAIAKDPTANSAPLTGTANKITTGITSEWILNNAHYMDRVLDQASAYLSERSSNDH